MSLAGRPLIDDLKDRLGADYFERLDAKRATLEQLVTGRSAPKETMKAKTRELALVLEEATSLLGSLRSAILNAFPTGHQMRRHFGVGIKLNPKSMNSTIEALRMFIDGMEQYPAEAAAAKLQPRDLEKLKGFLAEIPAANDSQEGSKNRKRETTALLESTNYDVYKMLTWLKVAADIDLAHDPKARNAIVGPLTVGGKKRNKAKEPAK